MKKKRTSVISLLLVTLCFLPTIACSEIKTPDKGDRDAKPTEMTLQGEEFSREITEDESDTVVVQSQEGFTSSSYETLGGVSPEYEIGIHSSVALTDSNLIQYIAISDQNEEAVVDLNVESRNENYYISQKVTLERVGQLIERYSEFF